ncbi:HD domain-containing protein [Xylanimonas sp. McL0601]|uniref:HD domain-containing protein n=1 Tax=Xylanimonas sp. McL0601 TaxID=3414739 RepID=UPI003CEF8A0C
MATQLELPDSPAVRAAHEVASTFASAALLNHSVRAYLFAADYGDRQGIAYDAELLAVGALLHDIALTRAFDNYGEPFEHAGGHIAWVLGAGAGWPVERRERVALAIVDHMADESEVPVEDDPEGHLLARSTGLDVSGRNAELWPAEVRDAVLRRHPRLGFADEFLRCFRDQAERKPSSSAARAVASGIAGRVRANPLETPPFLEH